MDYQEDGNGQSRRCLCAIKKMVMDYGQSVKGLCFMDYNITRDFYKEKGFTLFYIFYIITLLKMPNFLKK